MVVRYEFAPVIWGEELPKHEADTSAGSTRQEENMPRLWSRFYFDTRRGTFLQPEEHLRTETLCGLPTKTQRAASLQTPGI